MPITRGMIAQAAAERGIRLENFLACPVEVRCCACGCQVPDANGAPRMTQDRSQREDYCPACRENAAAYR